MKDIFDVDNIEGLTRKAFQEREIQLNDMDLPKYSIPKDHIVDRLHILDNEYKKAIHDQTESIVSKINNEQDYNAMFTAVYEGILNAYQHGNNYSAVDPILISHKIDETSATVAIMDKGGKIDADLIPFILRHRENKHEKKFMDFYEFKGIEKPSTNLGTGTYFMHTYAESIKYYKSPIGGLAVVINKQLQ